MGHNNSERTNGLAAEIKRQIGSAQNTRYLRSLSLFQTPRDDAGLFDDLLRRIDEVEAHGQPRRQATG
jgi:hypothetical protein